MKYPRTKTFSLRLTLAQKRQLRELAATWGVTMAEALRRIVQEDWARLQQKLLHKAKPS